MSVGAGSIRRAANAANTADTAAGSKTNEEMAAKSETIQRAENRLAARKAGTKYVEPKTEAKPAFKPNISQAAGAVQEPKAEGAAVGLAANAKETVEEAAAKTTEKEAEAPMANTAGKYEAYGVGQELPVYLM